MKIILIILAILITTSSKSFSLEYGKTVNTNITYEDGTKGRAEVEGFFGEGDELFPNCKKMNVQFRSLKQGLKVFYKQDGSIHSSENGLYDCSTYFGKITHVLVEGFTEGQGKIRIHYKRDNAIRYFYFFNDIWHTGTDNVDVVLHNDPNSNYIQRPSTPEEINHAERLYKFYKEIDLSSPNAKKYNVINTSINLNESKKNQDPAPAKKQSESGVAAELERLQKLFNSGAITKDEYQKAKNKVLK